MQRIEIKTPLGNLLISSPSEGGRQNRSFLNYHLGITELDDYLKDKKLSDLDAEFGIQIYKEFIVFMLYREKKAVWIFPIPRQNITEIKAYHDQNLNIRKDPKVSAGTLRSLGYFGILGGIAAGTIDALTSSNKVPNVQVVLGSKFEIFVESENNEHEIIVVSCTNKNKLAIEQFLKKIILLV